jgi:predicted DNA-binding transcriptional regulator AlpA
MARHANARSGGEPVGELRRRELDQARLSPDLGQAVESDPFAGGGGHARLNGSQVGYLRTAEVASLLGVSPNMLREWERRYAFPRPRRSPGKARLFAEVEIAALRDALRDSMSVCGAVARARAQVDRPIDAANGSSGPCLTSAPPMPATAPPSPDLDCQHPCRTTYQPAEEPREPDNPHC